MIGIIGAMEIEVQVLKEIMTDKKIEKVHSMEFCVGKIGDKEVVVATCGVGKVFASMCATAMVVTYSPELIINTGVGGALLSTLKVGDIAISDFVIQHDMDTTAFGDPLGMISGINLVKIPASQKAITLFTQCLKECDIDGIVGTIATGDKFVEKKEEKLKIKEVFNAVVCEMEGGAIAQVCYWHNVEFCILRAVSDGIDDNHMDFQEFCALAVKNSVLLLGKFMEKWK